LLEITQDESSWDGLEINWTITKLQVFDEFISPSFTFCTKYSFGSKNEAMHHDEALYASDNSNTHCTIIEMTL